MAKAIRRALTVGQRLISSFTKHNKLSILFNPRAGFEETMKDPYRVLREKERDVERVRKEIQALHTVIPLLSNDQLSSDDLMPALLSSVSRESVDSTDNGTADLEPFVRHLRNSSAPRRDLLEMCRARNILIASTEKPIL
jgi:hypothetical protein